MNGHRCRRGSECGRWRWRWRRAGARWTDHPIDRYRTLSVREREIFQLVAECRSNKEIAALLFISPSTVETHRAHIMEKLDLHSAAEIVLYAVRRGVIR